ncbi:hypothetical protein J2Z42_002615 [Clostridium algifaecis]|uniref:Uncharacterized protein n=1 Tax=Clostridium algifaecis TaxID=1472040 RepID=A0ABS4KV38_9CLOT|nr:hypothetical protein [Clostridium algifaecis]
MLKFFGHMDFSKIRVNNFKAVFKNKTIYLKVKDKNRADSF